MLTITVEDSAFRAKLQQIQTSLGNLTPVMSEIGGLLENNVRQRFETCTDPNGAPWHPWAKSTEKYYPHPGSKSAARVNSKSATRAQYGAGNARLLDRYGTMLGSLNYQTQASSVTIGFANDYAVFHEYGTQHMDRRGLLLANPTQGGLGADDEADVLDIVNYWLAQQVRA